MDVLVKYLRSRAYRLPKENPLKQALLEVAHCIKNKGYNPYMTIKDYRVKANVTVKHMSEALHVPVVQYIHAEYTGNVPHEWIPIMSDIFGISEHNLRKVRDSLKYNRSRNNPRHAANDAPKNQGAL